MSSLDDHKELENDLLRLKRRLRQWEKTFEMKHGRPPVVTDIQQRERVESGYKEYNNKKKQLTRLQRKREKALLSQPPRTPTRHASKDFEYIRSPSHPMSRQKYDSIPYSPSNRSQLDNSEPSRRVEAQMPHIDMNEEEAFWLEDSQASQKEARKDESWLKCSKISGADLFALSEAQEDGKGKTSATAVGTDQQFSLSQSQDDDVKCDQAENLLEDTLGHTASRTERKPAPVKRRKKNVELEQKLFGHLIFKPRDTLNPALRAERKAKEEAARAKDERNSQPQRAWNSSQSQSQSHGSQCDTLNTQEPTSPKADSAFEEEPSSPVDFTIVHPKTDPFRHYDQSHFRWEDPEFKVPCGFFSSSQSKEGYKFPRLYGDPERKARILQELANGTLGTPRQEDEEAEPDEDLRLFIEENRRVDDSNRGPLERIPQKKDEDESTMSVNEEKPNTSLASSSEAAKDSGKTTTTYKKKPIQKRQTRLYKLRFVE